MQEYNVQNQQTQVPSQFSSQPQPPRKKGKVVLAAVLAVVYTAVVVAATVFIDRAILKDKLNAAEDNNEPVFKIETEYSSDKISDGNQQNNNGENGKKVALNEKFTVGPMFEITLLKSEWCEKILPSNTSGVYSYYDDTDGEKYLVVKAKVKNVSSQEIDFQYVTECKLKVDGKYEIEGKAESEEQDGTSFYGNIKPLQEVNAIIYFSVSDEMYSTCSEYEVVLDVANNEEAAAQYSFGWKDGDYDRFSITLAK